MIRLRAQAWSGGVITVLIPVKRFVKLGDQGGESRELVWDWLAIGAVTDRRDAVLLLWARVCEADAVTAGCENMTGSKRGNTIAHKIKVFFVAIRRPEVFFLATSRSFRILIFP